MAVRENEVVSAEPQTGGRRRRASGGRTGPEATGSGRGGGNGKTRARGRVREYGPAELLDALQQMAEGNFAVRLPEVGDSIAVEIAAALNGLAKRNEELVQEISRVSWSVGREGRMTDRATLRGAPGSYRTTIDAVNNLIADLVPADHRNRARADGGRRRRPVAEDGARDRRQSGAGRVPAHRHDREHDGGPARARSRAK